MYKSERKRTQEDTLIKQNKNNALNGNTGFVNNRADINRLKQLQSIADSSPQILNLKQIENNINGSISDKEPIQRVKLSTPMYNNGEEVEYSSFKDTIEGNRILGNLTEYFRDVLELLDSDKKYRNVKIVFKNGNELANRLSPYAKIINLASKTNIDKNVLSPQTKGMLQSNVTSSNKSSIANIDNNTMAYLGKVPNLDLRRIPDSDLDLLKSNFHTTRNHFSKPKGSESELDFRGLKMGHRDYKRKVPLGVTLPKIDNTNFLSEKNIIIHDLIKESLASEKSIVNKQKEAQCIYKDNKEECKGNFTTVGFEFEFCEYKDKQNLGKFNHLVLGTSKEEMPLSGLGFILETDYLASLELITPPLLVPVDRGNTYKPQERVVTNYNNLFVARLDRFNSFEIFKQGKNSNITELIKMFNKYFNLNFNINKVVEAKAKNLTNIENRKDFIANENSIVTKVDNIDQVELLKPSKAPNLKTGISTHINMAMTTNDYMEFLSSSRLNEKRGIELDNIKKIRALEKSIESILAKNNKSSIVIAKSLSGLLALPMMRMRMDRQTDIFENKDNIRFKDVDLATIESSIKDIDDIWIKQDPVTVIKNLGNVNYDFVITRLKDLLKNETLKKEMIETIKNLYKDVLVNENKQKSEKANTDVKNPDSQKNMLTTFKNVSTQKSNLPTYMSSGNYRARLKHVKKPNKTSSNVSDPSNIVLTSPNLIIPDNVYDNDYLSDFINKDFNSSIRMLIEYLEQLKEGKDPMADISEKVDFMSHKDQLIGMRQDTYISEKNSNIVKPDDDKDKNLMVVELRNNLEKYFPNIINKKK